MQQNYDITVEWEPFELHPEVPAEGLVLSTYQRRYFAGMVSRLEQMAAACGMEITFSEVIPNSRLALEASEFAREQGCHNHFHQAVFRKFYGEGMDLRGWALLRDAAEEVTLDPDEMQRNTEAGLYRDLVSRKIATAQRKGITAVPAYIFNDKYAIFGAQPYQAFEQLMTRLLAEKATGGDL